MKECEAEKWIDWLLNIMEWGKGEKGRVVESAKMIASNWEKIDEAFYTLTDDDFKDFLKEVMLWIGKIRKGKEDPSLGKTLLSVVLNANTTPPIKEYEKFKSMSKDEKISYTNEVLKYIRSIAEKYGEPYGGVAALKWLLSSNGQAFITLVWKPKYREKCVAAFTELLAFMLI